MASDRTPTNPDRDATVVTPAPGAQPTRERPVEGAHATRGSALDAVAVQRARFGGIKWGAAFFGWLSANGLAVILVALLSAAGVALGLANGVDTAEEAADEAVAQVDTVGLGGAIAVLVILFLAYLAGGYVAGRMARFDGARQGLATWLIGLLVVLLLAAAGAILGAQYNVLEDLNLPRIPVQEGEATTAGIVTLVAILLVTLLGAVLGGKLGERYHRKIDRVGAAA
jgi:MFS family permease